MTPAFAAGIWCEETGGGVLRPEHQHSGLVQKGRLHGVPELRKWPLSQHKGQSAEAEPHHPVSHPSFAISSVAGSPFLVWPAERRKQKP